MRGAAIILAMLIAALAAAVAATVFADQQRWMPDVEHRRDQVQAQALAHGGRAVGAADPRRRCAPLRIDHLGEPWALTLPPIPLENGEIRGAIVDAQGRLNINALGAADASAAQRARAPRAALRAARACRPPRSPRSPTGSTPTARPREAGAEDAFYLAQPVPRLAANAPVAPRRRTGRRQGRDAAGAGGRPARSFRRCPRARRSTSTPRRPKCSPPSSATLGGERLEALVADRARKPFTTIAEFRARLPRRRDARERRRACRSRAATST